MREIKSRDVHPTIRELLSYATSVEKVDNELDRYINCSHRMLYEILFEDEIAGLIGVEAITPEHYEIRHIAVSPQQRGQGIGSKMIRRVGKKYGLSLISAETDCEAVEFYRKYGFEVKSLGEKYPGVERFRCEYRLI